MPKDASPPKAVTLLDSVLTEMSKNETPEGRERGPVLGRGEGRSTASAPRSTDSPAAARRDALERGQGDLEALRDLQAGRAHRGPQDARLHLHGAHARARRRRDLGRAVAARSARRRDRFADGTLRLTTRQGDPVPLHQGAEARAADPLPEPGLPEHRLPDVDDRGVRRREPQHHVLRGRRPDPRAAARARASSPTGSRWSSRRARSAYYQVFLTDEAGKTETPMQSDEPIYGKHYLPRKFKVAIAHPLDNSVDVLTNDVGVRAGRERRRGRRRSTTSTPAAGSARPTACRRPRRCSRCTSGACRARRWSTRPARSRSCRRSTASAGPPPGALEVHHPASGARLREARAARALRARAEGRRAAAARARTASGTAGTARRATRSALPRHPGRERPRARHRDVSDAQRASRAIVARAAARSGSASPATRTWCSRTCPTRSARASTRSSPSTACAAPETHVAASAARRSAARRCRPAGSR